jgi:probable HAF family extracellular repeat protein
MVINDGGQVAGYSDTALGEQHAFLWADGRIADLTAAAGAPLCNCSAFVLGINARGQVVGVQSRFVPAPPPGNPILVTDAVLWENGTRTIIAAGDAVSFYRAERINDRGEVSGTHIALGMFGVENPFFWRAGSMQEWNLGGISSKSVAMNKYGQVVGEGRSPVGELHGFSWSAGRVTDLGRPSTWAADVNEHGLVVGSAYFPNKGTHAALWTPIGRVAPRVVPGMTSSVQ